MSFRFPFLLVLSVGGWNYLKGISSALTYVPGGCFWRKPIGSCLVISDEEPLLLVFEKLRECT